jgi:hypothetical protein
LSKGNGRGSPPVETRFRKGQSGNPGGRPKSRHANAPSAFDVLFDRTLSVQHNGAQREMTVDEALEQKTYQQAIAGDRKARRDILKMIVAREQALSAKRGTRPTGPQLLVEHMDPDNADEALQLLDIARLCPRSYKPLYRDERLMLEPWAVKAALHRRSLGPLSADDIALIEQSTRDPQSLRWPKNFRRG